MTFSKLFYATERYIPILVACIVGCIIVFPSAYFRFEKGYQGLDLLATDAEPVYVAEIREIYDGNYRLGNTYLADEKDAPYVQQPLSPMLIAFIGKILHLSVPGVNILTRFLFPSILTLILYFFFLDIFHRKSTALLAAVFIMMTPGTLTFLNPSAWIPFLKGIFIDSDYKFLSYARPINPQVSSLFVFGYFLCVWKFLYTNPKKLYGILATVLLGLSFYTYFFAFSLLFMFNACLGVWYLYTKKWAELKKLVMVVIGGLIIGIPYFFNFVKTFQSPFYTEMTQRFGTTDSHAFIFSRIWWGAFLAVLLLYRKKDQFKLFSLIFLVAVFILTNQHVLTGKTVPIPSHYHWYYVAPLGGVFLLVIILSYLEKFFKPRMMVVAKVSIAMLFFWSGIVFQQVSYAAYRDSNLANQKYASIVTYLDRNIAPEKTVLSNDTIANLLPVYTGLNIYQRNGMGDSLVSSERLKHTYFVYVYLKGITSEQAREYFYDNREELGGWIYSQTYHVKNGCYGCMPDQLLEQLITEYQEFLTKDFKTELLRYPLDYIVWDTDEEPTWHIDRYFKNEIYREGNLAIYQVE